MPRKKSPIKSFLVSEACHKKVKDFAQEKDENIGVIIERFVGLGITYYDNNFPTETKV